MTRTEQTLVGLFFLRDIFRHIYTLLDKDRQTILYGHFGRPRSQKKRIVQLDNYTRIFVTSLIKVKKRKELS